MAIGSIPLRGISVRRRTDVVEADYDERAERTFDLLVLIGVFEFLVIAAGIGVLALQAAGLDWPR